MFKNLMFITHSDESAVQLEQVRKACEAGVEWIQIRIKAHSKEEIKGIGKRSPRDYFRIWRITLYQ